MLIGMADKERRMHEILSQAKDFAIELGRAPTALELADNGICSRHEITKYFGGNTLLLQQIGMKPQLKKKIDNTIFNRDIESHLLEHAEYLEEKFR